MGAARGNAGFRWASTPILVGERLVGVMGLFARQRLSETTLQALGAVADTIALGIARAGAARLWCVCPQEIDDYTNSAPARVPRRPPPRYAILMPSVGA